MAMRRSYYQYYYEILIRALLLLPFLILGYGFMHLDPRVSILQQQRVCSVHRSSFRRKHVNIAHSKFPTHIPRPQLFHRRKSARTAQWTVGSSILPPIENGDETTATSLQKPKQLQQINTLLCHLQNNPKWIWFSSFFHRITNDYVVTQAFIVIALYLFHLTVLTQHLAILCFNYVSIGYDSLLGFIVFMVYYMNRMYQRRRPTVDAIESPSFPWTLPRPPSSPIDVVTTAATASNPALSTPLVEPLLSNSTALTASQNSFLNWMKTLSNWFQSRRFISSTEFTWLRFRISMMITVTALVKAYFQTGTYSLFWEDLLYTMSAAGWPLTVPLSRSIQVLAGHLTWVAAGSLILWAIPRPPPFFRGSTLSKSSVLQEKPSTSPSPNGNGSESLNTHDFATAATYKWFRMSLTKCNWLWWTIGGYFVSSWLFNVADMMNRYILPTQVLQDAAESVVTQLVQPEHNDLWASAIGYIAPCITAPVWEELLYRGFLLAGLTAWTGSWHFSCVLQAILFSAHHMSITAALPLAVLGYAWAVLYTHSKNLWTVIAVHAMWNSRVFFGSWFGL